MRVPPRRLPIRLTAGFIALGVSAAGMPASHALYSAHGGVVDDAPAAGTPNVVDGKVLAVLPIGADRVVVGGTFTSVKDTVGANKGQAVPRLGLFAADRTAAGWVLDRGFVANVEVNPDPDAPMGVEALAYADGHVFAGGFNRFMGTGVDPLVAAKVKLVKLNPATGVPAAGFTVSLSHIVKDMAVSGDRLFLAGQFTKVAGDSTIRGLAAIDVDDGSLDHRVKPQFSGTRKGDNPLTVPVEPPSPTRVETIGITPDGKTLVAAGNFTKVDGHNRFQIALFDVTKGETARVIDGWNTDEYYDVRAADDPRRASDDLFHCADAFDTIMRDVDVSPDGKYFVVVTTGGYSRGNLCDTATRWEFSDRGDNVLPTWIDSDGGDSFTGVAVTGAAVYVSGHMRGMNDPFTKSSQEDKEYGPGAVERFGIAALDPESGLPLAWRPDRVRGEGAWALVSTPYGLWVGSDSNGIGCTNKGRVSGNVTIEPTGCQPRQKLSLMPLAGGAPAPQHRTQATLPADLYRIGGTGISKAHFDGSRLGAGVSLSKNAGWDAVRGAFWLNDRIYTGNKDGQLLARSFDGRNPMGSAQVVNQRGIDSRSRSGKGAWPLDDVTGMFYAKGRLYFSVAGEDELFYRYFLSERSVADDVLGTEVFVADDSHDWSDVAGMTMVGGRVYWAEGGSGDLYSMALTNGVPTGSARVAARNSKLGGRGLWAMPVTTKPPVAIDPPDRPAPPPPPAPPRPPAPAGSGYWMVGSDGSVYSFGQAKWLGSPNLGGIRAVDLEPTPVGQGYWIVDEAGRVFAYNAASYGNADALGFGERATSLSATPSGKGYWIFTNRGRVVPKGDAGFYGDMSRVALNGPVLDSIPTPSGRGYFMVASDGGIFAFGDAVFRGSMGGIPLNAPVQSLVPDADRAGYWLVASDGGIFAFDAPFKGSMGSTPLARPVTGMVRFGDGYLMVGEDGGIFNFSTKPFYGSLGANPPANPVVSVAALDG